MGVLCTLIRGHCLCEGPHLFNGLFSYPVVVGSKFLGLGLPCVFGPIGERWMFVARVQPYRTRALLSSLLLIYVEEEGMLFDDGKGLRDVFALPMERFGSCRCY